MSNLATKSDFDRTVTQWLRTYLPAGTRDQQLWTKDWLDALGRIKYVHTTLPKNNNTLECLLAIRCIAGMPMANLEMVQADFVSVWSTDVAKDLRAIHAFVKLPDAFELHFAAVTKSETYITGRISVTMKG